MLDKRYRLHLKLRRFCVVWIIVIFILSHTLGMELSFYLVSSADAGQGVNDTDLLDEQRKLQESIDRVKRLFTDALHPDGPEVEDEKPVRNPPANSRGSSSAAKPAAAAKPVAKPAANVKPVAEQPRVSAKPASEIHQAQDPLQNQLNETKGKVENLKSSLTEQQAKINSLRNEQAKLQADLNAGTNNSPASLVADHEDALSDALQKRINQIRRQLPDEEFKLGEMGDQLKQHETKLNSLQDQINQKSIANTPPADANAHSASGSGVDSSSASHESVNFENKFDEHGNPTDKGSDGTTSSLEEARGSSASVKDSGAKVSAPTSGDAAANVKEGDLHGLFNEEAHTGSGTSAAEVPKAPPAPNPFDAEAHVPEAHVAPADIPKAPPAPNPFDADAHVPEANVAPAAQPESATKASSAAAEGGAKVGSAASSADGAAAKVTGGGNPFADAGAAAEKGATAAESAGEKKLQPCVVGALFTAMAIQRGISIRQMIDSKHHACDSILSQQSSPNQLAPSIQNTAPSPSSSPNTSFLRMRKHFKPFGFYYRVVARSKKTDVLKLSAAAAQTKQKLTLDTIASCGSAPTCQGYDIAGTVNRFASQPEQQAFRSAGGLGAILSKVPGSADAAAAEMQNSGAGVTIAKMIPNQGDPQMANVAAMVQKMAQIIETQGSTVLDKIGMGRNELSKAMQQAVASKRTVASLGRSLGPSKQTSPNLTKPQNQWTDLQGLPPLGTERPDDIWHQNTTRNIFQIISDRIQKELVP